MNWKLIVALSGFALVMAVGTVFFIPPKVEPILWVVIFVVCAWLIAKNAPGKPFLHGLGLGLVNCVWVTTAHIAFASTYLAGHPDEAKMAASMSSPRMMMALTGPLIGVVSGVVLGLFALVAWKLAKR
jgi:hypothetical protein